MLSVLIVWIFPLLCACVWEEECPPMRSKCEVQYTYNALIIESSEVAADTDVE